MRLPRMTIWRWMAVVGLMAAGVWVLVLGARSHSYAIRAGYHGLRVAENKQLIEDSEAGRLVFTGRGPSKPAVDRARRLMAYHAALKRKYELAYRRPWIYVALDPLEPE